MGGEIRIFNKIKLIMLILLLLLLLLRGSTVLEKPWPPHVCFCLLFMSGFVINFFTGWSC
jgi:hypothetical protein